MANNATSSESNREEPTGASGSFRQDFLASIVVFLVALPLCMGIAIASGVPVAAGLITGIVGGLVVGSLAGAPLQVSGPAAGLTVIIYELVQKHGLEVLGIAVLLGGAMQLAAGLLRYGRWFRAVSPAVIHGMLAGIGVLILASQFHVMVDDAPKGNGIQNLISIPEAIKKGLPMPDMGTAEERQNRRWLLNEFGTLHEEQVQLRELSAERIPLPAVDDLPQTREEIDEPEIRPEMFTEIAERQEELSERFDALVAKVESRKVSNDVRDPAELATATQDAQEKLDVAIDDLQVGNVGHIRVSQADLQRSFESVLSELKSHRWAAKIGIFTIVILILWNLLIPKSLKLIPAPLVAVVSATAIAVLLQLPILSVELPDNLWSEIHFPSLTVLQSVPIGVVIQGGIVLAAVASAETLLCATAVDKMQSISKTKYDRELAAQGVGNMVCGLLGALPMTGVIVRSSANVDAGARTRTSAILHGAWLLIFVSALPFVLRMIPTAALAAMLVYIGYKLVNINAIKELRKYGWGEVAVYFITLGTIVCTDLLTGVITGIAISAARLLHTFSRLDIDTNLDEAAGVAHMRLSGAATFIRLPALAAELESLPENVELHVDLENLRNIDHACLDLLMSWAKQHEDTGGTLVIDWESLHANFNRGGSTAPSDAA